ncbi:Enoyl-CoA hydratase domain-containing protein 3 [Paramyrothecium foliicola]|nr:Enoyl-CoA hydratase domain-containing protein 3 [Paramyrothecium foliicola]
MGFPKLPANAAYIHLRNVARRNALSLEILRDLRHQFISNLKSPATGRLLLLPEFKAELLETLEGLQSVRQSSENNDLDWLVNGQRWREERTGLPKVLVLRSDGPVFSSGHDLKELASASRDEVKETFSLCAEVIRLIRHSPVPVICPIQGLATAAGSQLALATDYPIALDNTQFQLPGTSIGLPCTSPSTVVSRRASPAQVYRMFLTAEAVKAEDLHGAVDVVKTPEHAESTDTAAAAFEARVSHVVNRLASAGGQSMALGKWAYWTQLQYSGASDALAQWAGRAMALHAKCDDAKQGMQAFLEKRKPEWTT